MNSKTQVFNTEQIGQTRAVELESAAGVSSGLSGVDLAGYQLKEKIGSGGYGEVWRAIGPGGLPKAFKILYGERSGKHAEVELKALERMRELRHPFLLSIERIEVVDSRVIVVSELADRNLSERFDECRSSGLTGLPREELLGYLKDAADALDFMSEQYGLQHLDIKPDNLLIQGNHAKVADFGLAKNVGVTNVSAVTGFTPRFAAPELFEGRPSKTSDQYSLAIVYQMMLTGVPPFNGRTAAQLTAQHLRSQPDLTELQPIDRPVIARALSKNVHSRFDNCRQFVDELHRRKLARSANRVFVPAQTDDSDLNRTALVQTSSPDQQCPLSVPSAPIHIEPADTTSAPARTAVVVGLGGLAGNVLRNLRESAAAAAETRGLTHIPLLHIDTDRSALTRLRASEDEPGLLPDETLCIPLKSSKHYRAASDLDLSWISRRWLFNIPRSGQVEGIRPLGRLALYDHRMSVRSHLEKLLKSAKAKESLDVYVVASTSGGTGSGAVSDIALMVRQAARSVGIGDVKVHGVLLHGTASTRHVTDLQDANTVATLRELRQLHTPGLGFNKGFERSQTSDEVNPFDACYLMHLGDGLSDPGFRSRCADTARFLLEAAVGEASFDFQAWREPADDEFSGAFSLRLLGIGSQDATVYATAANEGGNLAALLIRRWCGVVSFSGPEKQHALPAELTDCQTLMAELKLSRDTLPRHVMNILKGDCGREIDAYAQETWQKIQSAIPAQEMTRSRILDYLTQHLAQLSNEGVQSLTAIVSRVQQTLASTRRSSESTLLTYLKSVLDSPHRLEGAVTAAHYIIRELEGTLTVCQSQASEIARAFQDLENQTVPFDMTDEGTGRESVRNFCRQYCVLLAYQTIYHCFATHISAVSEGIKGFLVREANMKSDLEGLSVDMASQALLSDSIPQPVVDAFDKHLRQNARSLVSDLYARRMTGKDFSRRIVNEAMQFLLAVSRSTNHSSADGDSSRPRFPQNAWPFIRECGGSRRVLGLLPGQLNQEEWNATFRTEFGDCVAVRPVAHDRVCVVCEISNVPVESILNRLTCNNPHVADVASRIHTRIDVEW